MTNLKRMAILFFCALISNSFLSGMQAPSSPRNVIGDISSILVSPNSKYYAIVFSNGDVKVFLNSKKLFSTLGTELGAELCAKPVFVVEGTNGIVTFSPDCSTGVLMANALKDGSVNIINMDRKEWVCSFSQIIGGSIDAMSFSCNGEFLVVASLNRISMFDLKTENIAKVVSIADRDFIFSLQWSLDGNFIAVGTISGEAIIFDAQMDSRLWNINGDWKCPAYVAWNKDSSRIAVCSKNRISIYEKGENCRFERFVVLQEGVSKISAISWHPSGDLIVTVADGFARIWDIRTLECLRILGGFTYPVNAAKFSPDGERLIMNFGPRVLLNNQIDEILRTGKCAFCQKTSEFLVEKDKFRERSCLICPDCKASGMR